MTLNKHFGEMTQMNLNYVKEFLKTHRENLTSESIDELISEIEAYQGTENNLTDISKVMRVINEYNLSFLTEVQEYEVIPKDTVRNIPLRMEKVRGILCTLSALHTYLTLSLSSIKDSVYETKNIRGYLSDLNDKREHYKSEKMTWVTILKSLSQEAEFTVEMRRLDIEDEVGGYIKYKNEKA